MIHATKSPQIRQALIADDDPALRILFRQIIHTFGFDVACAENGRRALEMYKHADGRFDLLVTDIRMPEMNGCELIREIRSRDQKLPIIAVTGFAEPELIREIASYQARLFEKPVNFSDLHSYIDSLPPHTQ